jgi:hypothetical protein
MKIKFFVNNSWNFEKAKTIWVKKWLELNKKDEEKSEKKFVKKGEKCGLRKLKH